MITGLPQLTLYMREGCHLCEDMEQQLAELIEPGSYSLERVDIDEDETLTDRFNIRVPLLCLGELELCEHFLDLEAVRLALAGYNN